MAGRYENLVLAEFILRVPANARRSMREAAQRVKDRLATGTYTVAAARTDCRTTAAIWTNTLRQWRDNFLAHPDAAGAIAIVGLSAAQRDALRTELLGAIGHFANDAAANAGQINALCDAVLAGLPAATEADEDAGTRFRHFHFSKILSMMGT